MADIVMFGTGQFAEVAVAYLERDTTHNIVAFALDRDYIEEPTFQGKPVVAFEVLEQHYPPDQIELFIPLSYKKMNRYREQHYLDAKQRGYRFITYISSHARIHSHTKIGENCTIRDNIKIAAQLPDRCRCYDSEFNKGKAGVHWPQIYSGRHQFRRREEHLRIHHASQGIYTRRLRKHTTTCARSSMKE